MVACRLVCLFVLLVITFTSVPSRGLLLPSLVPDERSIVPVAAYGQSFRKERVYVVTVNFPYCILAVYKLPGFIYIVILTSQSVFFLFNLQQVALCSVPTTARYF